jgi:glycosyltransferase involved in cell wall biosynthesis
MLSICIPTYNYDVRPLVNSLHLQAQMLSVPFEILIADDASPNHLIKQQNRELGHLAGVRIVELEQNEGRSRIRNRLAEMAQFEWLLFLDCDTMPCNELFVKRYVEARLKWPVVVGGIAYRSHLDDETHRLRWTYGHQRESKPANQRSAQPYQSFMTGNFMISKELLNELKFDESITRYGHEDTLMGLQLKKRDVAIGHIDNPAFHDGLESNEVFLDKTRAGIENLVELVRTHPLRDELVAEIRLLRMYAFLKRMHLLWMVRWFFAVLKSPVEQHLRVGTKPNMRLFDFYKLGYLVQKMKV